MIDTGCIALRMEYGIWNTDTHGGSADPPEKPPAWVNPPEPAQRPRDVHLEAKSDP